VFNGSELTATVVESQEVKIPAQLLKTDEVNRLVVHIDTKGASTKPPATGKRERSSQPESPRSFETILLVGRLEGTFKAVD
jgi:hypothetical protein